ncbi:ABC transporter substrate-binding protein [Streptomyces sp. NBC_01795]|uniref:ABC transporter substrate-binding protein n=1 Tax=unclassified Streptomyces TaxID=2593676 RepID=UPI002DD8345E|nr:MULTISPECIES: ABC transporter substrate-binding protein [unclassified Streptomyces]WSA96152.1 ABC transporter substrate-binding protein [Streptomyces sp. NBC_01795]WSB80566.1 ABC transporter substrate-binding protein [Streptomyces sp. NBC_01775]WSS11225.1 ABC transporter substrate-binding protein [Streptomyces sp. NBC_01186]
MKPPLRRPPVATGPPGRRAAALAAAGVLLLTSGCTVANSGSAAGADAVQVVLPEEPPTLEPCDASLTATGRVVRSNITEPLAERVPKTGGLEPKLATGWKQTSPTTWRFALRKGVTFHDGTAFSAKDAAFSIDRTIDSRIECNVDGYVFGDSELTATAVDSTTLKVTTAEPDPILPLRLSFVEMVPTSTAANAKVREPVGTGPYRVDAWNQGINLRLDRYEGYWGKAPDYAAALYTWRAEGSVRAAMISSGEADVAVGLAPADGAGDNSVEYPNNETSYLRMDAGKPPLDDLRVRRAINYAIDKKGLVASVFAGLGKPAGQLVPDGVTGYNPDIKAWPYDMKRAKSLIKKARADGVPVGTKITIIGRNGIYPKAAEAMEVVQSALREAGLNVEVKMLDVNAWTEYLLRPFPKNAGPTLLQAQHGNQAGDAAFTMDQIYGSKGAQSSYGTPGLDKKIQRAGREAGRDRQAGFADALAYQSDKVVRDAVLAHMKGIIALAPDVSYKPNSASGDEMHLAEIHPAG